jgi:membrane-associated phospholipid phosphatase
MINVIFGPDTKSPGQMKLFLLLQIFLLAHSFLSAQEDSVINAGSNHENRILPWAVSGALFVGGSVAALDHDLIDRPIRSHSGKALLPPVADDMLSFMPMAAVYLLDFTGVKAHTDIRNRTFILMKAGAATMISVHALKRLTAVQRPDSSNFFSFPSGHTALAFMSAAFLHHEFGQKNVAYSIAGFAAATLVGVLRVQHDRHWASDVLAGAGLGLLCTEIAYRTHRYRWLANKEVTLQPFWSKQQTGVYVRWRW